MELEIIEQKENPFFGRKEIVGKMKVEGTTPSRKEILSELKKKMDAKEDCIILEKVEHKFGSREARIYAKIYEKAEDAKKEPGYKNMRNTGEKKKKGEEKPAA